MAHRKLAAFVPPEHGAWAMLLVPFLLGTLSGTPSGWSLLLLTAWLSAYLASYYSARWLKTRHLKHRGLRFRAPTLLYSVIFVASGLWLAAFQPWLLIAACAFIPLEVIAVVALLRGDERSLVAGVASATAASLMAPVAYHLADGDDRTLAASLFSISWLAFSGAVLHVKSTIRERDDVRYRRASIGFHVVAMVIAGLIDLALVIPFGFLLLRSVLVPRHGWRPSRIGAVEIVGSTLVLVVPLLTLT